MLRRACHGIAHRLEQSPAQDTDTLEILLDIDEAAQCLLRDEEDKLRQEQRVGRAAQSSQLEFQRPYRALAESLGPAARPAKKAKASSARACLPESLELLPHAAVKKLFPPECALWKSRSDATWHCQVKGWPGEKSRSARTRGEDRAIRLLCTEAWYQWGVLKGLSLEQAPMQGLLPISEVFSEAS